MNNKFNPSWQASNDRTRKPLLPLLTIRYKLNKYLPSTMLTFNFHRWTYRARYSLLTLSYIGSLYKGSLKVEIYWYKKSVESEVYSPEIICHNRCKIHVLFFFFFFSKIVTYVI